MVGAGLLRRVARPRHLALLPLVPRLVVALAVEHLLGHLGEGRLLLLLRRGLQPRPRVDRHLTLAARVLHRVGPLIGRRPLAVLLLLPLFVNGVSSVRVERSRCVLKESVPVVATA